jgi:hypothetical protein
MTLMQRGGVVFGLDPAEVEGEGHEVLRMMG